MYTLYITYTHMSLNPIDEHTQPSFRKQGSYSKNYVGEDLPQEVPNFELQYGEALDEGYKYFHSVKFGEISNYNNTTDTYTVDRIISDLWTQMTDEERQSYMPMQHQRNVVVQHKNTPQTQQTHNSDADKRSFVAFCTEKRMELQAIYPDATLVELHQIMTAMWAEVPQHEKEQYAHKLPESAVNFKVTSTIHRSKAPPTAYVVFCRDKRAEVKAANPGASIADMGRILGSMWTSLDEESKKIYFQRAADQAAVLSAAPPKFKAPITPYITFCCVKRADVRKAHPEASFGDIGKMLGTLWAGLSSEEKLIYAQMANEKNFLNNSAAEAAHSQSSSSSSSHKNNNNNSHRNTSKSSRTGSTGTDTSPPPITSGGGSMKRHKVAPTAYITFCREKRAEVRAANPDATIADMGRILGGMWTGLDAESKKIYFDKANEISQSMHAHMNENMINIKQSPSPYITFSTLKRLEVKTIFPEVSFSEMGRVLGALWAALGDEGRAEFARIAQDLSTKPDQYKDLWTSRCKIPTPFALFCADYRDRIRPACGNIGYIDIIKTFTAEWCGLAPEDRQSYIKKSEELEQKTSVKSKKRKRPTSSSQNTTNNNPNNTMAHEPYVSKSSSSSSSSSSSNMNTNSNNMMSPHVAEASHHVVHNHHPYPIQAIHPHHQQQQQQQQQSSSMHHTPHPMHVLPPQQKSQSQLPPPPPAMQYIPQAPSIPITHTNNNMIMHNVTSGPTHSHIGHMNHTTHNPHPSHSVMNNSMNMIPANMIPGAVNMMSSNLLAIPPGVITYDHTPHTSHSHVPHPQHNPQHSSQHSTHNNHPSDNHHHHMNNMNTTTAASYIYAISHDTPHHHHHNNELHSNNNNTNNTNNSTSTANTTASHMMMSNTMQSSHMSQHPHNSSSHNI